MPTAETVGILDRIAIAGAELQTQALPKQLALREELGLVTAGTLNGKLLYSNPYGGLFEIRATKTPGGDYLMMFPDGLPNTNQNFNGHYGGKKEKVNVDIVSFGESDENADGLRKFVETVNGKDGTGSHLVTIPPGPHLSDALISSPILQVKRFNTLKIKHN